MLFLAEALVRLFSAQESLEVKADHPLPSVPLTLILGREKEERRETLGDSGDPARDVSVS